MDPGNSAPSEPASGFHPAEEPLPLAAQLCLACGKCCSDIIFEFGAIPPEDVAPARELGMTIIERDGGPAFALPCALCVDRACTVHKDPRKPSLCGQYECVTLRGVVDGEVSIEEGLRRVAALDSAAVAVREVMEPGELYRDARERAVAAQAANDRSLGPLVMRVGIVEMLLDRHFRYSWQKRMMRDGE